MNSNINRRGPLTARALSAWLTIDRIQTQLGEGGPPRPSNPPSPLPPQKSNKERINIHRLILIDMYRPGPGIFLTEHLNEHDHLLMWGWLKRLLLVWWICPKVLLYCGFCWVSCWTRAWEFGRVIWEYRGFREVRCEQSGGLPPPLSLPGDILKTRHDG